MNAVPVPQHAIGRVGLVAMLQKVKPADVGRLVVVRCPVGYMSSLVDNPQPVFAWQVLVLGPEPIELNGQPRREIVVADRCLQPVSQLEPRHVETLAKARARSDFDDALGELRRYLERNPLTPAELDEQIARAAEQALIQHGLEIVPTAVALKEINFTPASGDEDGVWHWSGTCHGVELYVTAAPDMFGRWTITGRRLSAGRAMWDERMPMSSEPRGKVAKTVLELWRAAFGRDATVPTNLNAARRFEQGQKDIARVKIGLPTLQVDGEILRTTRRWLAQRHGLGEGEWGPLPDIRMNLSYSDGLLRMALAGTVYGCPARGVWVDDCGVSLREFLAVPYWHLRGRRIALERSLEAIALNGSDLRVIKESAAT